MKRLLILLLLSPFILVAQTQGKQVNDSSKDVAAINIQSISGLMGNNPCAKVADIRITHNVTDSGEYITTTVFFHRLTALDSADDGIITVLLPAPIAKINKAAITVATVQLITDFPPLPVVHGDEPLAALLPAVAKINMEAIPVATFSLITNFPPLPFVYADTIAALLPAAVAKIKTEDIPIGALELITDFPPLPSVYADTIAVILPAAIAKINMEAVPAGKMDVISVPPLPFFYADTIAALLPAVAKLNIKETTVDRKALITDFPPLPFVYEDNIEPLALVAIAKIHTEEITVDKKELITNFPQPELRTPVAGMHLSVEGYSLLQKLEGYSPDLYSLNDGGYTIGFGFFIPFNEGAQWRKGITWEEAERLMKEKMPAYEDQVKKYVNVQLTQNEFDALTMLAYNLGGFSKATSIINDVNNQVEFEKLKASWKKFVHSKATNVSKGLMNRRKDELEVREISYYQPNRKIQIFKSKK